MPDLQRLVTRPILLPTNTATPQITIPDGHWYRVISGGAGVITDPTAVNRTFQFVVEDATLTQQLNVVAPAAQASKTTVNYVFGPLMAGYSNLADPNAGGQQFPIPDMLWPGGFKLGIFVLSGPGFPPDIWNGAPAPQLYIEDYVLRPEGASGDSLPIPTPILV